MHRNSLPVILALAVMLVLGGACMPYPSTAVATPRDPAVALGFATPRASVTSPAATPAAALASNAAVLRSAGVMTPDAATPEQAVQNFYDWYLSYARTGANPLSDKAYRSSSYLAPDFLAQVDQQLASFQDSGFDPFLCAQDLPDTITVGPAEIKGDQATLVVRTSFKDQWLSVSVTRAAAGWQITGVGCSTNLPAPADAAPPQSPEKVVQAFYDWYIAQARRATPPAASGAYKTSPYLTEAAVQGLEQVLAAFGDGPRYDPVLCAQNIPQSVSVDPAEVSGDEARVFVRLAWDGSPSTSQTVVLKLRAGAWKINDLTCAVQGGQATSQPAAKSSPAARDDATAHWQLYRNAAYGYEIKYPQGWTSFEPETAPAAGGPLVHVVSLAPVDASKGPAPISIELYQGSEEAFRSVFPGTGRFEAITVGDRKALYDRGDAYRGSFYVFAGPAANRVRVVIRVAAGTPLAGLDRLALQMAETLQFVE